MSGGYANGYELYYGRWGSRVTMNPSIKILQDVTPNIWTRVCLTVDFMNNVVQVFRDSNMSIRKRLLDGVRRTKRDDKLSRLQK